MITDPPTFSQELNFDILKPWQVPACKRIIECIKEASKLPHNIQKRGHILVAPTRTGKTFTVFHAIAEAQRLGFLGSPYDKAKFGGDDLRFAKVLIIGTKSLYTQHTRVAKQLGVKDFMVTSYSGLRAALGRIFIDWIKGLEYGVLVEKPFWNEEFKPDVLILDEVQFIKNYKSQAAEIVRAAIEQGILCIMMSATPGVTIDEMKLVCLGCKLCSSESWKEFSWSFCGKNGPTEISPTNMARLNTYFEEQKVISRHENITYLHKVFNKCLIVPFQNEEKRDAYNNLYNNLLAELRKIKKNEPQGIAKVWAKIRVFRMGAEILKVDILGNEGHHYVNDPANPKQVLIASNYVDTLIALWNYLTKELKVPPKDIVHLTGSVNTLDRQVAIDKFQHGKAKYFLTTIKAGGVGLSLHHEFKEALPRVVLLPPTYSGPEMAQVLGRAHGPTSLSTTHQFIVWYRGTIEESVAERAASRFKCMKELYAKRETFFDVFENIASEDIERLEKEFEAGAGARPTEDEPEEDKFDENMFSIDNIGDSSVEVVK